MPEESDPPSIGEQLERALEETEVSQSELARRLATKTATVASKRRWILKVLADEEIGTPDMAPVTKALGLPNDYFVIPTPEQADRRRVRLSELEKTVAQLREDFDRFVRSASLRRAEFEADQELPTHQADQPSSPEAK